MTLSNARKARGTTVYHRHRPRFSTICMGRLYYIYPGLADYRSLDILTMTLTYVSTGLIICCYGLRSANGVVKASGRLRRRGGDPRRLIWTVQQRVPNY